MLDQLAKNSLLPEQALTNGRPTVLEFYADWCEACKQMAPDMFEAEKISSNQIDIVLLNVFFTSSLFKNCFAMSFGNGPLLSAIHSFPIR